MRKSVLWILTVFLSLAMVALVLVQTYWIRNSIEAKEEQLGLVVNQVLLEISNELERDETVMTILEEIQAPLTQHRSTATWNFHIDARSRVVESREKIVHPQEPPQLEDQPEEYIVSEREDEEIYLHYTEPSDMEGEITFKGEVIIQEPEPGEVIVYTQPPSSLKNQRIKLVDDSVLVILGEDELLQDTILISALDPAQIRQELRKSLEEQEAFVQKIVRQMLVDDGDIEDRITAGQIRKLLAMRLAEKGVDIPFEFAVQEKGGKPTICSEAYSEGEDCRYYRASLLPGSVLRNPTLITVYFPEERKHLLSSMGMMGASSALITLLVLSLFSLALYIIFKQKRLSEMKNDFVNNMTHELKTPISTISLASQMLNDKSIPSEQKNLSQISRIIQTESKQLGFQVERVLQMAIFDHGQLKLKQEELDMHELIENVAQNFLLQLEKRGGELEFSPIADESIVFGDHMHLVNVVSNLLENAVKYTKEHPAIRVETRNEKKQIVVSVSDNGIGISKEDQKRIFDKFYRVPTGNVHNVKGFGLGLSYVKLIVEQHRGSISLKSEPGKGSRFDIVLPLYTESGAE